MKNLFPFFVFGIAVFSAGCTTTKGMTRNASNDGISREYNTDYQTAFDLAKYACRVLDFKIENESVSDKYIVAENGMSSFSWGERIGFYFTAVEPQVTRVRILSKAKIQTNFLAPQWPEELHTAIRARLEQLQAEGIIPS